MKLAASVIVRNERARYLEVVLAHLLEFCDLVCVLDDESSDGWEEAFRPGWGRHGSRVLIKQGTTRADGVAFNQHAAARNQLLQFTLAQEPDAILAIDADELVSDGAALRTAAESRVISAALLMEEVWEVCDDLLCIREDGGWSAHPVTMLWKPHPGRAYGIRDLGHATGRTPLGVGGGHVVAECLHLGWSNRAERAERYERYAVGDAGKYHAASHIASIMWPDEEVTCRARPWPAALEPWRQDLLARANGVAA